MSCYQYFLSIGCFHFNLVSPISFYRVLVSVYQTHVPWPTVLS